MTKDQIKNLFPGALIQSGTCFGVIVDPRIHNVGKKNFAIQWIGGGCSIWTDDERNFHNCKVVCIENIKA